nr:hypothetical protein [Tanacetum cinerariifolium]
MWALYHSDRNHAYKNFEIAAGLEKGEHKGPPFHDGDFFKLVEALSASYAVTHDPKLDKQLDEAIALIVKVQRPDGYLSTQSTIAEQNNPSQKAAFKDRLNFETYNL